MPRSTWAERSPVGGRALRVRRAHGDLDRSRRCWPQPEVEATAARPPTSTSGSRPMPSAGGWAPADGRGVPAGGRSCWCGSPVATIPRPAPASGRWPARWPACTRTPGAGPPWSTMTGPSLTGGSPSWSSAAGRAGRRGRRRPPRAPARPPRRLPGARRPVRRPGSAPGPAGVPVLRDLVLLRPAAHAAPRLDDDRLAVAARDLDAALAARCLAGGPPACAGPARRRAGAGAGRRDRAGAGCPRPGGAQRRSLVHRRPALRSLAGAVAAAAGHRSAWPRRPRHARGRPRAAALARRRPGRRHPPTPGRLP